MVSFSVLPRLTTMLVLLAAPATRAQDVTASRSEPGDTANATKAVLASEAAPSGTDAAGAGIPLEAIQFDYLTCLGRVAAISPRDMPRKGSDPLRVGLELCRRQRIVAVVKRMYDVSKDHGATPTFESLRPLAERLALSMDARLWPKGESGAVSAPAEHGDPPASQGDGAPQVGTTPRP